MRIVFRCAVITIIVGLCIWFRAEIYHGNYHLPIISSLICWLFFYIFFLAGCSMGHLLIA